MVGSFNKIDYRLRPAKHAERAMLLDLYKHLRFSSIQDYQYVGFGSVAFIDFRQVHRTFGLTDLISIEGTDEEEEQDRFTRNKPYDSIDLRFGHSSAILPQLDFSRHSLVWLDYDNTARRSMATDMGVVASRAKSGTFLAVTYTNDFPTGKESSKIALQHLKDGFPEFVAHDAKATDFQGKKYSEFVRRTFSALLQTALSDADAGGVDRLARRTAFQVCYFKYNDGAQMATIGWLIVSERDLGLFEQSKLDSLPFYRDGDQAFMIKIPKVTPFEIREMERKLPNPDTCPDLSWIPLEERRNFAKLYRYLPSFSPIEPV